MNRDGRQPMPLLPLEECVATFGEVALGYDAEAAVAEAKRCLHCKNRPCESGCPVGVAIPDFLSLIAEGKFEESYRVISQASSLPAVCGRVCPQERQCEGNCTRGIKGEAVAIGRLERFVADEHIAHSSPPAGKASPDGRRVAVVGSGPAGLACAGDLARLGYRVTVFEALHVAGGVLVYGIPQFRLPKQIVAREVEDLCARGVRIETNVVVGKTLTLEELAAQGFEAVFLGTGAGLPRFMGIPGENARGVFSANEYLTRCNLMKAYEEDSETPVYRAKRIAVVGGGNVAMDAARCAVRLGAEKVFIVYRRSEEELPARAEEVAHAKEEGVEFRFLTNPVKVLSDGEGNVCGIECVEMTLGEPDASGRRSPSVKEGSLHTIDVDCVIMALGTSPNPLLAETEKGLAGERGKILADAEGRTALKGVFAGGDAVTGSATVIRAMGAGKTAAKAIDEYLRKKDPEP